MTTTRPKTRIGKNPPNGEKTSQKKNEVKFPVVGIGASAGGLEAFEQKMLLNAREIIGHEGAPHLILLAMEVIAPVGNKEEKGKSGRLDRERV
jgi:hypothetical protein